MLLFFEIGNIAAVEAIALRIPESVGLLAFGVSLVVVAVSLRTFFARAEKAKTAKQMVDEV